MPETLAEEKKKMTEITTKTQTILQRFMDAERNYFSRRDHVDRSLIVHNPEARAKEYLHNNVHNSAERLLRSVEDWFGKSCRFSYLAHDWQVLDYKAEQFTEVLKVRGFVSFNVEHLKGVVSDLRHAAKDFRAFDEEMYEVHGVDMLLDGAEEGWNRSGAMGMIKRVASMLAERFAVEVELISLDEALDQMHVVLDCYAAEYENLLLRAADLQRQAVAATGK
jgi:hypothetical protein